MQKLKHWQFVYYRDGKWEIGDIWWQITPWTEGKNYWPTVNEGGIYFFVTRPAVNGKWR